MKKMLILAAVISLCSCSYMGTRSSSGGMASTASGSGEVVLYNGIGPRAGFVLDPQSNPMADTNQIAQ